MSRMEKKMENATDDCEPENNKMQNGIKGQNGHIKIKPSESDDKTPPIGANVSGELVSVNKTTDATERSGQTTIMKLKEDCVSRSLNMSDYKIMESHLAIVKIDEDTNFCRIQTDTYVNHKTKSKEHYVKQLETKDIEIEGDIGLRPGDLLLEVQGIKLENRSQKDVLRIFKQMKPNKDDCNICIGLVFRRWEERVEGDRKQTYEVDYQLELQLEPEWTAQRNTWVQVSLGQSPSPNLMPDLLTGSQRRNQCRFKVAGVVKPKELKETKLPQGEISDITPQGQENCRIKAVYFRDEKFLTVANDGLLSLEVGNDATSSENVFTFSHFRGMDRSQEPLSLYIYCTRITSSSLDGNMYLTVDLNSHTELKFQSSNIQKVTVPDDVDETCFILRKIGREVLFESLLHRGLYIGCRSNSDESISFVMIEKSKDDIIYGVNLEDVTFEQWPVKEAEVKWSGIFTQIPQVFRSLFSCAGNKMLTRCVR